MATVINLNRTRKGRARQEADRKAAENRIRYGRSKNHHTAAQADAKIREHRLDQHRRVIDGEDEDS